MLEMWLYLHLYVHPGMQAGDGVVPSVRIRESGLRIDGIAYAHTTNSPKNGTSEWSTAGIRRSRRNREGSRSPACPPALSPVKHSAYICRKQLGKMSGRQKASAQFMTQEQLNPLEKPGVLSSSSIVGSSRTPSAPPMHVNVPHVLA